MNFQTFKSNVQNGPITKGDIGAAVAGLCTAGPIGAVVSPAVYRGLGRSIKSWLIAGVVIGAPLNIITNAAFNTGGLAPTPVALNEVVTDITTSLEADDSDCYTPSCKEARNDLYSTTSREANSAINSGPIESFNVRVTRYDRNDDGTYRIVGDIIEDRTSSNATATIGAGLILGIFNGEVGGTLIREGAQMAVSEANYIVYDENFSGIKAEVTVEIDNVSFESLEGFDKGKVITISNLEGVREFGEYGRCGIFDSCSTFDNDDVRIEAKSAEAATFKF